VQEFRDKHVRTDIPALVKEWRALDGIFWCMCALPHPLQDPCGDRVEVLQINALKLGRQRRPRGAPAAPPQPNGRRQTAQDQLQKRDAYRQARRKVSPVYGLACGSETNRDDHRCSHTERHGRHSRHSHQPRDLAMPGRASKHLHSMQLFAYREEDGRPDGWLPTMSRVSCTTNENYLTASREGSANPKNRPAGS
jgi:hypothetical protein